MQHMSRLQRIFRDVFDDATLRITGATSVENLSHWDSVAMIQVILATEEEFGVRFGTDEVAAVRSVADIVALLEAHGA